MYKKQGDFFNFYLNFLFSLYIIFVLTFIRTLLSSSSFIRFKQSALIFNNFDIYNLYIYQSFEFRSQTKHLLTIYILHLHFVFILCFYCVFCLIILFCVNLFIFIPTTQCCLKYERAWNRERDTGFGTTKSYNKF